MVLCVLRHKHPILQVVVELRPGHLCEKKTNISQIPIKGLHPHQRRKHISRRPAKVLEPRALEGHPVPGA